MHRCYQNNKNVLNFSYRALAESTVSFNRRLNEERKMRIPYIDGQVKHSFVRRKVTNLFDTFFIYRVIANKEILVGPISRTQRLNKT